MNLQRRQDLLKKFGKRLAYFRNKKRLSLRYLAAASRLDPSDILKYENGMVNPTLTTIGCLLVALAFIHANSWISRSTGRPFRDLSPFPRIR